MRKDVLEKVFNTSENMLDKNLQPEERTKSNFKSGKTVRGVKEYWKTLGPGLTTGAADDDPSGIATYSQMGASRGFNLIWLSLFSFPLMGTIQEMCARIGLTTGVGLATNIKRHYPKKILYICTLLLLFANVFNIGADLGAMAKGTQLIFPKIGFAFLVLGFAVLSLGLQIFIPYKKYSKYLKYLALVLFAYVFSAFSVVINWGEIFKHLVIPTISFSKDEIILICAAFGTTISPYLFFWQTSQEVEEQILKGEETEKARRTLNTNENIHKMRIDVWSGMFFSNLIMFFIIATSAAVLFGSGIINIATAADAALALKPFAGDFAFTLFAIGIVGVGLLAIPVLAGSASYAMSEVFDWREGLYRKLKQATAFYGVIVVAMILFFIVRISASEKIMGNFKNKKLTNILGWLTVGLLFVVSLTTIIFILK